MLCGVFSTVLAFLCIRKCTVNRLKPGAAGSPCQNGNCLILWVFLNALLVLTKMNVCCMNDVSKQEREREWESDREMKSVFHPLCKSVNCSLSRGLGWGSFWGITQFSVVIISFPLGVPLMVAWVWSDLDLLLRTALPTSFLDIVSIAVRIDQNYCPRSLVFSPFVGYTLLIAESEH